MRANSHITLRALHFQCLPAHIKTGVKPRATTILLWISLNGCDTIELEYTHLTLVHSQEASFKSNMHKEIELSRVPNVGRVHYREILGEECVCGSRFKLLLQSNLQLLTLKNIQNRLIIVRFRAISYIRSCNA